MKALENGITLIDIPCWWDGSIEKLIATIHFRRPDLNLLSNSHHLPISLNPHFGYFTLNELPQVGELMLASFPSNNFFSTITPKTWWMGEKYDGIRGCWVPSHNVVYTRSRNKLKLDSKILNCFPSSDLIDCEFWFGRGQFANIYSLISDTSIPTSSFLRAVAFDVPYYGIVLESRYTHLLSIISKNNPIIKKNATRIMNKEREEEGRKRVMEGLVEGGAEGLIFHRSSSLYLSGRSPHLLKLKAVQGDAEAIVVRIDENKSVHLQLPNGTPFTVPKEDVQVTSLKIGDVISYSFEGNARRTIPVNPVICRLRPDLIWKDVVQAWQSTQNLPGASKVREKEGEYKTKPLGHWSMKKMRAFLERFAKSNNFDPLNPHSWYKSYIAVRNTKDGQIIIQKLKGYQSALSQLFPEVKFNFFEFGKSNWSTITNRRKFFEVYANTNNFDPYVAENWYQQSRAHIMTSKGAYGLITYYDNDLAKALIDVFPDIGLDFSKLFPLQLDRFRKFRQRFFMKYANNHNFDPLHPDSWYSQRIDEIMATKNADKVTIYYNGQVSKALVDLFPNINLDESKFSFNKIEVLIQYDDPANRRKLLEEIAKDLNFDPLIAANWYKHSSKIKLHEKLKHILVHHSGRVFQALYDLFPEVEWKSNIYEGVFSQNEISPWSHLENRRTFFEEFAKENKFDPLTPENWINRFRMLKSTLNFLPVLRHYSNSIYKALIYLFPEVEWSKSSSFEKALSSTKAFDDKSTRRRFFEDYAKNHNFDYLDKESWISHKHKVISAKNTCDVIAHHDNLVFKALMDLFPEAGWKEDQFINMRKYHWSVPENRRQFFIDFAKDNHFDPLVPSNWDGQTANLYSTKHFLTVKHYHGNTMARALPELFPEIDWNQSSLYKSMTHKQRLQDMATRRGLLEEFAKKHNFDPLILDNWHSNTAKFARSKEAQRVLAFHDYSVTKAARDLFDLDKKYHEK